MTACRQRGISTRPSSPIVCGVSLPVVKPSALAISGVTRCTALTERSASCIESGEPVSSGTTVQAPLMRRYSAMLVLVSRVSIGSSSMAGGRSAS